MGTSNFHYRLKGRLQGSLCALHEQVERFGRANGFTDRAVFNVSLAIDELVTNVRDYGYAPGEPVDIDISLEMCGESMRLRITDTGRPFNILDAPEPELDKPIEERVRQIGGMGVHLVKKLMDHIDYRREDGRNVLTLVKEACTGDCRKVK